MRSQVGHRVTAKGPERYVQPSTPRSQAKARAVDDLPSGGHWQFEPKYDGFRCLAFRTDEEVHLQSRNQKPLRRYFPEIGAGLRGFEEIGFVLDGEIIIPGQSFEILQLRLHPAASRIP